MPNYWCVNFDDYDVLLHGIEINSWMMQYQYEHAGFDYQGGKDKKAKTTISWQSLPDIVAGDWLLAYLKPSTFYAIGEVVEPRVFGSLSGQFIIDTVDRTTKENRHLHFDGIVRYSDAPAFYENHSDTWKLRGAVDGSGPAWFDYAQRIDVEKWLHYYQHGVTLGGLATVAPFPEYRKAYFRISSEYFDTVADALQAFIADESGEQSVPPETAS